VQGVGVAFEDGHLPHLEPEPVADSHLPQWREDMMAQVKKGLGMEVLKSA